MSRFLSAFETYFQQTTDAPAEFGHAAGLACLSTLALGRRHLTNGLQPNVFLMLVGNSSRDRKSTSISLAMEFIEEIEPKRLGPSEFSPEGLLFHMRKKPGKTARNKVILPFSEFGNHLALAQRSYAQGIGPLLCQLYDGETIIKAKAGKRPMQVVKPRLTILGGCAFGMLEKYTDPVDWEGGFFARMLFVVGQQRPNKYASLRSAPTALKDLARAALNDIKRELELGVGPMALAPAAQTLFENYVASVPDKSDEPALIAQRERLLTAVLKLAMLYQIDVGGAPLSQIPMIDVPAVQKAIDFSKSAWASFQHVYTTSSGTQKSRFINRVLDTVKAAPGEVINQRELCRRFHAKVDELQGAIDVLLKVGWVKIVVDPEQRNAKFVKLIKDS